MAKPISTTIKVNDKASGALQNISKNLGKCINGFMRLNQVSSTAINVNINILRKDVLLFLKPIIYLQNTQKIGMIAHSYFLTFLNCEFSAFDTILRPI